MGTVTFSIFHGKKLTANGLFAINDGVKLGISATIASPVYPAARPRCNALQSLWLVPLLACLPFNSLRAGQYGLFTYTDLGSSIRIVGYPLNAAGPETVPDSIIGKPVTEIGNSAFSGCRGLTKLTLPAQLARIGDYAFLGCFELGAITFPATARLASIAASTFAG